jgi:hypothetical protein
MQVDYKHIIKLAYPTEPVIFTDAQLEEITRLIKYADYYEGDCFKYITQKNPEYGYQHRSKGSYNPATVTVNYTRKIIDKLASFQFETPIDISVTSEANEKLSDVVEEDLYDWHKRNKMDLKLIQASKEHNISGGVVFKLIPDDELGEAKVYIRGRIEVFPVYDFDDYEKLVKVHFIAFMDEYTIWKQTFQMIGDTCFIEEAIYDTKQIEEPKEVLQEFEPLKANGKPLDFMPVYIIPNLPSLGEVWGLSEIKDLIPLQDEINKKYSDLSDSLRFEMFAITVLLNIADTADNTTLQTKPGATWQLFGGDPTGGTKPSVEKLESTFQYIESLKYHLDSIKSIMFELSDVVQLEGRKIESIGNLSGVALKILYGNMASKINQKNTIWIPILEDIYRDSLKIKSAYGYKVPDDMGLQLIPHVPIPQNKLEEIQVIAQKLSFNLTSVRAAMDELGVENPEMLIKEILDDKKTFDEAFGVYESIKNGK